MPKRHQPLPAPSLSDPESSKSSSLRSIAIPLALAIVTFAAFWPALGTRLLGCDDHLTLTNNPHVEGLRWPNIRWVFTHVFLGHYQPLALLSFALDYEIWGKEAFGFHLTNLLLHCANTVIFYFFARRLLALAVNR